MRKPWVSKPRPEEIQWLTQVREVRHPIHQVHPIIVRHGHNTSGPPLPHPTVPFPEQHPYCEFSFGFLGHATQFIGAEKIDKSPGAIMMLGPGVPHHALQTSYPGRAITVHFLPTLLFEMGPEGDGMHLMARFSAAKKIDEWVIQPPRRIRDRIASFFEQMWEESSKGGLGAEFRLRALLMEALVEVIRWERSTGRNLDLHSSELDWRQVEKALRFIYEHYTEPIYVEQIARAAGMNVNSLQALFRDALDMSCMKYLRAYRISQAMSLLCRPEARVTEVALSVGFETLSHFNVSFRNFIGMSPAGYIRMRKQNRS